MANNQVIQTTCCNLVNTGTNYYTYGSCSMYSHNLINDSISEKKKNVFEHIFYEMDMLLYCKEEIDKIKEKTNQNYQYYFNTLHTSSMTYLRNLIYFFFPNGNYDGDIFYTTILKDYSSITKVKKTLKDNCEQEISKNIHHITKKRLKENEYKKMEEFFNKTYIIIIKKCKKFLERLNINNVKDEYIEQLKDYEQIKNDLLNKLNNSISKYKVV